MTFQEVAGRYSLEREIGRGGAGAVWLAVDHVLERDVALKRIGLPPGAQDADVERAEREARLAARVTHPNVVAVFDFVAGRDEYWLVMEYVAGTNLGQMIQQQGPLPPATAARILAQATDGLAAAHQLGIVHRDVKPSNILVGEDGSVKLSDFGIARGLSDPSLTQTGLVTGSPAYLAPEVATGGSATTASDVWSVGATLYHALAGAPPYHRDGEAGSNPLATLYRIAHEPVPTLTTDEWAVSLLAAAMDHDPRARPTAAEAAARLRAAESSGSPTRTMPAVPAALATTARARHPRRRHLLAAAVAVLIALVLATGTFLATGNDETPGAAPSSEQSDAAAPTATELEEFARTYVQTASQDPDRGFAMLTAEYQAASPRYHDFWNSVRNPQILEVAGDPDTLRVTYTYEYSLPGHGRRSEAVVLHLVQQGDELLIAGDSTP